MSEAHLLELPEEVFQALQKAAEANGTTPVGYIAASLPKPPIVLTKEDREAAHAKLRKHIVTLGHPMGTDNAQIDADLAREYGDDHADLYKPDEHK